MAALTAVEARADVTTVSVDTARTGARADEAELSPATVGTGMKVLYDNQIDGQAYAQPLVFDHTVYIATERNILYAFDVATGASRWPALSLGRPAPADPGCQDLQPSLGVTATPVIDPATGTIYVTDRTWDGSSTASATWWVHAINASTGQEAPGWPVQIQGAASNDPGAAFDPVIQLQRPGLLLLDGAIFAGFGSFCDFYAYRGWMARVAISNQAVSLWTTEPGFGQLGSIWMAGGGPASDGAGTILVATANGSTPARGNGSTPGPYWGMSVVRLAVQGNGSLLPTDHWTPCSAISDSGDDLDLGSGGPVLLPDSLGSAPHPHLMVVGGKNGKLYVLDRDHLGAYQTPCNGDGTDPNEISEAAVPDPIMTHPAVWTGDGGYLYLVDHGIQAFQVGHDGELELVGATTESFGFGAGSATVSSDQGASGTALVWVIVPGARSTAPQLRAYSSIPAGGRLNPVWSGPLPSSIKFTAPVIDAGRVFVGVDGHLIAFVPQYGAGLTVPLTPARILDTRGNSGYPGAGLTLGPNQRLVAQVAGRGGVPAFSTVVAVAMNVAVTDTTSGGNLVIYPTGAPEPMVSNINWSRGQTLSSLSEVPLGTGGTVTLLNNGSGSVDVVLDVDGYVSSNTSGTAGRFHALPPARIADTRAKQPELAVPGGGRLDVQVAGAPTLDGSPSGVPATGVAAVVLNLAETNATAGGHLILYPAGISTPNVANLNFAAGDTRSNRVLAQLGQGGKISIYNNSEALDVVIDVTGWISDAGAAAVGGGLFNALPPARVLDTRANSRVGPLATMASLQNSVLEMAGVAGVPAYGLPTSAQAVVLHVTAVFPDLGGFLTLYPSGGEPNAADLNFVSEDVVGNMSVVTLNPADGSLRLINDSQGSTDAVLDIEGWYSAVS